MSGPSSASRGMSGPPAIDIGMNICGIGVRFAERHRRRVRDDADDRPARAESAASSSAGRPIGRAGRSGSWPGKVRIGKRLVHDDIRVSGDRCRRERGCARAAAACASRRCSRRRRRGMRQTAALCSGRAIRPPRSARCRSTILRAAGSVDVDAPVTPGIADSRSRMRTMHVHGSLTGGILDLRQADAERER